MEKKGRFWIKPIDKQPSPKKKKLKRTSGKPYESSSSSTSKLGRKLKNYSKKEGLNKTPYQLGYDNRLNKTKKYSKKPKTTAKKDVYKKKKINLNVGFEAIRQLYPGIPNDKIVEMLIQQLNKNQINKILQNHLPAHEGRTRRRSRRRARRSI